MTEPLDELVAAVAEAVRHPERNQWRGAYGAIPKNETAWHFEYHESCSIDAKRLAAIAVHTTLKALAESEAVRYHIDDALWENTHDELGPSTDKNDWLTKTGAAVLRALAALGDTGD